MSPMYWTLQNLKYSENKPDILHCNSMFRATTVFREMLHVDSADGTVARAEAIFEVC
jgi:hypothetical protein